MIENIKSLRIRLDGLAQLVDGLTPANTITNCHASLLLSKAWMGKMLGELGTETPYANDGKRKTVADIESTTDKSSPYALQQEVMMENWKRNEIMGHIEKVDWLRQEIEEVSEKLSKWYSHTPAPSREFSIARTNAYNHACEARFWLGFELERVKNSEKGDKQWIVNK